MVTYPTQSSDRQRDDNEAYNEKSPLITVESNQNKPTPSNHEIDNLEKAKKLLYLSHSVATFSELGWQFCLILFLTALTNFKSFTLVATYGLFTGSIVSLSSSSAGAMIDSDQRNRLQIAQFFIWVQNLSVIIATICCFFLLRSANNSNIILEETTIVPDLAPPLTTKTWVYIVAVHIFGALGKLTDQSMTVALERDWIVVMSKVAGGESGVDSHSKVGMEKAWLSQVNTVMKQIDLICKILAPAAAGMFFAYFGDDGGGNERNNDLETQWNNLSIAAMIVGVLNIISLLVELYIIEYIYLLVPLLAIEKSRSNRSTKVKDSNTQYQRKFLFLPRGLELYLQQSVFFGGFAAALLYLNILSFGTMMTAYLVFRGMSYQSVGILRGFSSTIGIMGTFVYRWSSRRHQLTFTGSWSIVFQFICLSLSFASLYISKNDKLSLHLLVVGVIGSRLGLYSFKLSITQMMQQMIPEDIRGIIGGVQKSINGIFELATYVLGLIYTKPEEFHILVAVGYASVGTAMCIYVWGIHRHHIILSSSD